MKHKYSFGRNIIFLLIICLLFSGCAADTVRARTAAEEPQQTISVAIYPHFPNVELFEELLIRKWEALEPDVSLNIEHWDCYSGPSDCDVLMYDAIVLTYLVENGYVQPIGPEDIENPEGIIPFAMEGASHNGLCYGVPYFLCGDVLIYYQDDAELAEVKNIMQLHEIAARRQKEDPNAGVVIYTEIDNPYHYLDASIDLTGEYSMFEEMPDCTNLNKQVMQYLQTFGSLAMVLPEDLLETKNNKELFCEGYGFAYYGVSEHMSYMGEILDKVAIKNLSFAEGDNIPLYYIDATSIASHVTDPAERELCKKIMNLVASEDFLKELCFENGKPQYLLPARESVYLSAAEEYPMYGQLHGMVMNPRNEVYRFGADFYEYLEAFPESNP